MVEHVCPPLDNWYTTGNSGTDSTCNFIGSTNSASVNIISGNFTSQHIQVTKKGQISSILQPDIVSGCIYFGAGAGRLARNVHYNIGIGDNSLADNISGNANIAIGKNSGNFNIYGSQNICIGVNSLKQSSSSGDIAIGYNSLASYGDFQGNVAIGFESLSLNFFCSNNATLGYLSMANGYTEYNQINNNVAIGDNALNYNNGSYNIGIGNNALASGTSDAHIAIGYNSSKSYTGTGGYNTALGFQTLSSNINGYNNNALGHSSMRYGKIGNNNVAIGTNSINNDTNLGSYNVAIGTDTLTSGNLDRNTCLGSQTSPYSDTIAIGYQAGINAIDSIYIGSKKDSNDINGMIKLGSETQTGCYIKGIVRTFNPILSELVFDTQTNLLYHVESSMSKVLMLQQQTESLMSRMYILLNKI